MPRKRFTEQATRSLPGYLPPDKRRCAGCDKVMKPYVEVERHVKNPVTGVWSAIEPRAVAVMHYGYNSHNLFCTLRCAYAFAYRTARAQRKEG